MIELLTLDDIEDVKMEIIDSPDGGDDWIDFSAVTDVATCPRYGSIHGFLRKKLDSEGREQALEFGTAFHFVASVIRLMSIRHEPQFESNLKRLIPIEFQDELRDLIIAEQDIDALFCAVRATCYYDDPRDKRRTVTNLEECCIRYYQDREANEFPVWIRDPQNPDSFVGIEHPFLLKLTYLTKSGDSLVIPYAGKIDGIHVYKDKPTAFENKTGSAINNPWEAGIRMSHQITGYITACELMTGVANDHAIAYGMQVPLPTTVMSGTRRVICSRNHLARAEWLKWVLWNWQVGRHFMADPASAVMNTHSCNRYFKECSFIPLCNAMDSADLQDAIDNSLVPTDWSPFNE